MALGATTAQADERFTYITNWYAQAEHGGFYQAIAEGIYKKYGLDVTVKMGGPQVNIVQLMAAGQTDCVMGSSDIQQMQVREGGVPLVTVAAFMQKEPTVFITHDDVRKVEELKGKTIFISSSAHRGYWPWLKVKYGLKDEQTRPYTYNVQPFLADPNSAQQSYLTSDTFVLQKQGAKFNTILFSDLGYPAYAATVTCMEKTVKDRSKQVANFIKASAEGWKSYLANPAPGNALIKRDNPQMGDDLLAYSHRKMKEHAIVAGGDAGKLGLLTMTDARWAQTLDFLRAAGMTKPGVEYKDAYTLSIVGDVKVEP